MNSEIQKQMNVLIACEFSGIVREAFKAKGHNAWSCDLNWTEIPGNHFKLNVFDILEDEDYKWDLLIAHPPCTYLCNSGVRWLDDDDRLRQMKEAVHFFNYLRMQDIEKIAIENPIPHKYALNLIGERYDQIVQPFWFGHEESKGTCLWLKNLPFLFPTKFVLPKNTVSNVKTGWADRSRTYEGFAKAMAEQWG